MLDLDLIEKPVDVENGEWVGNIPDHPSVRLKVRSRNYKAFSLAHGRLLRSFGKHASEAIHGDEYQAAVGALIADHLLIDWENAVTSGGKPVPYSTDVATKVLTSLDTRGMGRHFRDMVMAASDVVAARHLGAVEDVAKN